MTWNKRGFDKPITILAAGPWASPWSVGPDCRINVVKWNFTAHSASMGGVADWRVSELLPYEKCRTGVLSIQSRKYGTMNYRHAVLLAVVFWLGSITVPVLAGQEAGDTMSSQFRNPPNSARPWVYWFFMDGNLSREGMTADLEAMKRAGIGGAIMMEVDVGIPRGPVRFMGGPWRELFQHAVTEAERLGLQIAIAVGPGWCGTGGSWIKPEQSMQHLVSSEATVSGPTRFDAMLPRPQPREPFFGEATLTPKLKKAWQEFYDDVVVLAFPTPTGNGKIADIDEKALYRRAPYSSQPGVKPFLPAPANHRTLPADQCIASNRIIDLTAKLGPDGRLVWDVPTGNWTILRFGRTTTGQTTRPAPAPGLGFESDKFDKGSLDAHFNAFIEKLLKTIGPPRNSDCGLTMLHFDSWEMSSQNWSPRFHEEFQKRRRYDPLRFLPTLTGRVVDSNEMSERFLWDLRQTAQELILENHVLHLRELGRRHGLGLSIEPYDLNPSADLRLGSAADVPMCEFWSKGYGFNTEYSCIEAVSIAHTNGRSVVAAEAFTAGDDEQWRQHPGTMKAQGDWALCCGINRFVFHRYQHQPWLDRFPGMTMGPYGVHWERTQTWWDMASAFHLYLARCQHMLRRGLPVADVLYLTAEGAPHVFRPPAAATRGDPPDRLGYNFDGCDPDTLIERASAKNGRIVFPDGMTYRLLMLPESDTMTPRLLRKIKGLSEAGATVVGPRPLKSPSLTDYPDCDAEVRQLAKEFWPKILGPQPAADVLAKMGVPPDFEADKNLRYVHRRDGDADVYFVANGQPTAVKTTCTFRVAGKTPEIWDPITAEMRSAPAFQQVGGRTTLPLEFKSSGSLFVIFRAPTEVKRSTGRNFPDFKSVQEIGGPWIVKFDPRWGGPPSVRFDSLVDWTKRPEEGVRPYSGIATYTRTFKLSSAAGVHQRLYLDLGAVRVMARVKLNGQDMGITWTPPFRLDITEAVNAEDNVLEISVANLWPNRMIGDQFLPSDDRYAWSTWNPFTKDSPLLESGLLGPVRLMATENLPTRFQPD